MKTVLLLMDTLNRRFLPIYGDKKTVAPNFERLAEKSMRFDQFYCCSMPCMPARREMHTGRPNFMDRGWSPLEGFDSSVIRDLKEAGVYTHMITDHFHYWEVGGYGYLNQYNSFEMLRGQQGDLWKPCPGEVAYPPTYTKRAGTDNFIHDWVNRQEVKSKEDLPCAKVFGLAEDFLEKFHGEDNWFLTVESFSPHEPFFTTEEFLSLYPETEDEQIDKMMDWPDYGRNRLDDKVTAHLRRQYRAMISMADYYLGRILDLFDKHDLWKDTALILYTDHGFLLGEHGYMGKNFTPPYADLTHLPFFMHDPRRPAPGEVVEGLANSLNLAPTLAELFGLPAPKGCGDLPLRVLYEEGKPLHEAVMSGYFGGPVAVTDGRYALFKAPLPEQRGSLYNYTLAPQHMRDYFSSAELAQAEWADYKPYAPLSDESIKVMKVPAYEMDVFFEQKDALYDREKDPGEESPLRDPSKQAELEQALSALFAKYAAPEAFYERFGLKKP